MKDLKIGLQFFADENPETSGVETEGTESVESVGEKQTVNTENVTPAESENTGELVKKEKTFTQADLDAAINKRLAREKGAGEFLDKLAKRQNMTADEFIKSVEAAVAKEEVTSFSKEKNVTPEVAQEILKMKQETSRLKAENEEFAKEKELKKEWQELTDEYPDVKPDNIPKEVIEMASKGTKLVDAYARYENKQLKANQEELKKNAIKDYIAGKIKIDPVEGAGGSAVVTPSGSAKTWGDARKQALAFLGSQKEFKI